MPGKRCNEYADFVTPFDEYRSNVEAADAVSVQDPAIPLLDTRDGPYTNVGFGQADVNQYGRDATINLGVIIAGFSAVELELWLDAEPNRPHLSSATPAGSSSSSSSSSSSPTDTWVRVAKKTFGAVSELWVITNIPPGKYKVKVASVTGGGNLSIVESHAA